MQLTRKNKLKIALLPIAALLVFVAYEGLRVWWNHGYSRGERTGVVRKISEKGPPYCKYLSAEMLIQGNQPGLQAEVWEFSVDDDSESNPLVKELYAAEKSTKPITLKYRQDRGSLFRCTPSEYFVTAVDK